MAEINDLVKATERLEAKVAEVLQTTEKATVDTKERQDSAEKAFNDARAELAEKYEQAVKAGKATEEEVVKAGKRLEELEKRMGRLAGVQSIPTETVAKKSIGERFTDMLAEQSEWVSKALSAGERTPRSRSLSLESGAFQRQSLAHRQLVANGIPPTAETLSKALALSDATNFAPVFRAPDLPLMSRGRIVMRDLLGSRPINVNSYEFLEYTGAGAYTWSSMTSIAGTGTSALATTAAAHGLRVGDYVQIKDSSDTDYNGTFRVLTTPLTTTFTYTMLADPSDDTADGTILWRRLSRFGAAATVAEKGPKPQFEIVPTLRTGNCQVIAHYLKVTRQALDDIPGLQAKINQFGVQGLAETEDDQFLYGDGSSPNLQGILTLGTIQSRTQATAGSLGTLTAYRNAITDIDLVGGMASGIVMHPVNRESIDLAVGLDGQFMIPVGVDGGQPTVWKVPIASSKRIAHNTALVGDFSGAVIYDRQAANISFADQNEDDFLNNLLAIRFEERVGLAVERPEMFVNLTLI